MKSCNLPLFLDKPWLWLGLSLYYFVPLFYIKFDLLSLIFLISAYTAFVMLYLRAVKIDRRIVWQPIAGIIAIALLVTPLSPGSSTFFFYVGFLIGFSYSTRTYLILLSSLLILIMALHFRYEYPVPFFVLPATSGLITISLWGYIERMRASSQMRWVQSRQEIQQLAVIAERERIARDLHDILGHTLSSIALKAELAEKLLKQEKIHDVRQHLSDLHHIARESLSLVRQTVSGYKHRGLSGEVIQLCDKLRQNGFSVELTGDIPSLTPRAETALILALTELTTNILRHSKGNHCELSFTVSGENILISMQDNGCIRSITPGNGLKGIQERLHAIAGDISAQIANGCRFDITLPAQELIQPS
ncbi:MAG: sensor histidine kinase [Moraxellaceae bacterium]|nr:MAG: sensor histidine kinase [Moraxellaceae bacterium]